MTDMKARPPLIQPGGRSRDIMADLPWHQESREVALLNVPTQLQLDSIAHLDALIADALVMRAGTAPSTNELTAWAEDLLSAYRADFDDFYAEAKEAQRLGQDRLEIVMTLLPHAAQRATHMLVLLEQADSFAENGRVPTLPSPPAVRQLRRWMHEQIIAQLKYHSPPTRCPLTAPWGR
jgi:hypothetical protein